MKIRTDFVTNSSSSSFIFSSKTDVYKLYKHFHEKVLYYENLAKSLKLKGKNNYDDGFNSSYDYENAASMFSDIEKYIVTPDKLSLDEIMEILSWYVYDIAEKIRNKKNFNINKLTNKELDTLFAEILANHVGFYGNTESTLENKEEDLLYNIWDELREVSFDEDTLELLSEHYAEWVEFFNKYKMEPYKLLTDILDCKLVFFESEICQSQLVAKTFSEYETCIYYCNHMG